MPEGDTIFRTARALSRALAGKSVTRFENRMYAQLAQANDELPFSTGQNIVQIEACGKWLLIHFSGYGETGGNILATHMLMSGSWHIYKPGEPWQCTMASNARIVIETKDYLAVGFRIPIARMYTEQTLARERKIPRSEQDVLSPSFDAKDAVHRLMIRPNDELGNALLRQDVLSQA